MVYICIYINKVKECVPKYSFLRAQKLNLKKERARENFLKLCKASFFEHRLLFYFLVDCPFKDKTLITTFYVCVDRQ